VFDGSDAVVPGTGTAIGGGPLPNAINNVIHDLPNGIVGYAAGGAALTISGNNIYRIEASAGGVNHINFIETLFTSVSPTYFIHDNVLHDQIGSGAEAMFVGNIETDYIWNNIIWNVGNMPNVDTRGGGTPPTVYFYNNTFVPLSGVSCIYQTGTPAAAITIANTHCITTAALTSGLTGSPNITSNLLQTPTQASANVSTHFDQYSLSNVYSPVTSTNSTVGAGTNLASIATGNLANLAKGTIICTQQTVSGVVQAVCPAQTNTRPSTGAWDVGAYEFVGSPNAPNALNAPSGLVATVR